MISLQSIQNILADRQTNREQTFIHKYIHRERYIYYYNKLLQYLSTLILQACDIFSMLQVPLPPYTGCCYQLFPRNTSLPHHCTIMGIGIKRNAPTPMYPHRVQNTLTVFCHDSLLAQQEQQPELYCLTGWHIEEDHTMFVCLYDVSYRNMDVGKQIQFRLLLLVHFIASIGTSRDWTARPSECHWVFHMNIYADL